MIYFLFWFKKPSNETTNQRNNSKMLFCKSYVIFNLSSKDDENFKLSNHYMAPLKIDGVQYKSAEHYFQAQKFKYAGADKHTQQYFNLICEADCPQKAKDMGNLLPNYKGCFWLLNNEKPKLGYMNDIIIKYEKLAKKNPEWDGIYINVMRKGLLVKFSSDYWLKRLLLDTREMTIYLESSYDAFWEGGKNESNKLAALLMEIRNELKSNAK